MARFSRETVLHLGATEVHLDTSTATAKYWAQRYYSAGGTSIALRTNKGGTQSLSYLSGDPHGTLTIGLDATTQAVTRRCLTPFGATARPPRLRLPAERGVWRAAGRELAHRRQPKDRRVPVRARGRRVQEAEGSASAVAPRY